MELHLHDSLNFLSKITWRRLFNAFKVLLSYYSSRIMHRAKIWGMPVSIAIEPTTHCNLRCPECPSGLRSFTRPTGLIETPFYRKIIDELHKDILSLTLYFQGEPFLHPDFFELVKYASEKKIYTATSTNAHYLNDEQAKKTVESGLDRLIISIDGTTQETYSSYRIGGDLYKVREGAANIVRWKKTLKSTKPYLIFQFLVVRANEHQIPEVKEMAKKTGVDTVRFKTAQIYDYKNGSPLMPDNPRYSRYKKDSNGNFVLKNELLNHCWKLWNSCVITWNGAVVPCCFDKDANHIMGDLKEQSFNSLWKNGAYFKFRTALLNSRKNIDICTNCSEGTKVWSS